MVVRDVQRVPDVLGEPPQRSRRARHPAPEHPVAERPSAAQPQPEPGVLRRHAGQLPRDLRHFVGGHVPEEGQRQVPPGALAPAQPVRPGQVAQAGRRSGEFLDGAGRRVHGDEEPHPVILPYRPVAATG